MKLDREHWRKIRSLRSEGDFHSELRRIIIYLDRLYKAKEEESDRFVRTLDELIVILLGSLKIVIEEKNWESTSAFDLFEPVYSNTLLENDWGNMALTRFKSTKDLVTQYKYGSREFRKTVEEDLVSRGVLD